MNVRIWAILFGLVFLAVGILGVLPDFTANGLLFNTFTIHPFHNILHIVTGALGLLAAFSARASRAYFRVVGVVYLFLALLSFMMGRNLVFTTVNHADNLFHLIISLFAIYLGFGKPRQHDEAVPVGQTFERRHADFSPDQDRAPQVVPDRTDNVTRIHDPKTADHTNNVDRIEKSDSDIDNPTSPDHTGTGRT